MQAMELTVNGSWSPSCGERSLNVALLSQADLGARAIAGLWRAAGGTLQGQVIEKPRSKAANGTMLLPRDERGRPLWPLAVHQSPRLVELTRNINKTSDNLASRNLLLALSPGFPAHPATMQSAQKQLRQWLRAQGLKDGDIEVDNGSGLSRQERGKPRAMVQLLDKAWRSGHAGAFVESLPIAGVDGTLAHRMRSGAARGQAYLKTGSLNDARALAGYVIGRSGQVYAVAAMINDGRASAGVPALDALIEWIARNG